MLQTMHSSLETIESVQEAIGKGDSLFLAGNREALWELPRGNWVGGTIPYFMTEDGGVMAEDRIFAMRAPEGTLAVRVTDYGAETLGWLYTEAPTHGVSFAVMPAGSEVLKTFAEQAGRFEGFQVRPVVGWVAGVRVDRLGEEKAAVFNGFTGGIHEDRCAVLHVKLSPDKVAELEVVNIFESGGGDVIRFEQGGFHVGPCRVNGEAANLAEHIERKGIAPELPLVCNRNGSAMNVSIQTVDRAAGRVDLFAPVVAGVDYRFAKPVADYAGALARAMRTETGEPEFACNSILNFVYGRQEGERMGSMPGPITFGEIAHQLLNQTMVRLHLRDRI